MNSDNNKFTDDVNQEIITNEDTDNEGEDGTGLFREILETVIYFIVIVVIFMLLQAFVGQHIEVIGSSMENTLNNRDHLILEKLSYRFNEPARFDIIVFRPYDTEEEKDTFFIKRVIGLPGERIKIENGQIYINGEVLEENYGNEVIKDPGIAYEEIVLASDEYFLLGDNRNNSSDSRSLGIGPVKKDAIIGRAWARIWPLDNIEILNH